MRKAVERSAGVPAASKVLKYGAEFVDASVACKELSDREKFPNPGTLSRAW
jgi:hypothetical protein